MNLVIISVVSFIVGILAPSLFKRIRRKLQRPIDPTGLDDKAIERRVASGFRIKGIKDPPQYDYSKSIPRKKVEANA